MRTGTEAPASQAEYFGTSLLFLTQPPNDGAPASGKIIWFGVIFEIAWWSGQQSNFDIKSTCELPASISPQSVQAETPTHGAATSVVN